MDQVRPKIALQNNGNHIRNTLWFLYWVSGGIILYLLRNSSETRDKCKLKLFYFFFCEALYHAYIFSYLIPSFFFFIEIQKSSPNLPPLTLLLLLFSILFIPVYPTIPSYFLLPNSFQIREQRKKWENSCVLSSLSLSSVKKTEKRNAFFFFITLWHAGGLRYCWVHSMPITKLHASLTYKYYL